MPLSKPTAHGRPPWLRGKQKNALTLGVGEDGLPDVRLVGADVVHFHLVRVARELVVEEHLRPVALEAEARGEEPAVDPGVAVAVGAAAPLHLLVVLEEEELDPVVLLRQHRQRRQKVAVPDRPLPDVVRLHGAPLLRARVEQGDFVVVGLGLAADGGVVARGQEQLGPLPLDVVPQVAHVLVQPRRGLARALVEEKRRPARRAWWRGGGSEQQGGPGGLASSRDSTNHRRGIPHRQARCSFKLAISRGETPSSQNSRLPAGNSASW